MKKKFDFEDFVEKIIVADLNTVQLKTILYLASNHDRYDYSIGDVEAAISKSAPIILRELKKIPLIDEFINYTISDDKMYLYVLNRSFRITFNKQLKDSLNPEIKEVFEFWQKTLSNKRSKMDSKRVTDIKRGLMTYGKEECIKAIEGCSKTLWNMGVNEKTGEEGGKKFTSLNIIFRSAENVERFLGNSTLPPLKEQIDEIKSNLAGNSQGASGDWMKSRLGLFDGKSEQGKIGN